MDNPFLKRATEFLRDEEAFLAIVSPEPVNAFLARPGGTGELYDRLVLMRGTPGSGKTTLARLFEYPTLSVLLGNSNFSAHQALVAALDEAGAITEGIPAVLGYRLPLETDYRDFWEFPYPDSLKLGLMMALIQARAILGWTRNLSRAGIDLETVSVLPRPDAQAAIQAVGGTKAAGLIERARSVESSLYRIVGSLVAPDYSKLDSTSTDSYRPFDVIESISVKLPAAFGYKTVNLKPLIILDDAHTLHPDQFRQLRHWLVRRELRVARWVLSRLDVLYPHEALAAVTESRGSGPELPGITASRDTTEIMLQSGVEDRKRQRTLFRRMAKDMANRYLRQMPLFAAKNLVTFSDFLSTEPEQISQSRQKRLEENVDSVQRQLQITDSRRSSLVREVDSYHPGDRQSPEDIRYAMLRVLMYRYAKRTPQRTLFDPTEDPDPAKAMVVDASVYDAAQLHLFHQFGRPYYYGIDDLCDASSENAEQFLRLAAVLVDTAAAQLVRSKGAFIDASTQTESLRDRALEIQDAWNFPQHLLVRRLCSFIAERCLAVSLEGNAPLGAGANSYGIPQDEFQAVAKNHSELATVLQFGVAYNAFTLVPRYECKGKEWCLIELGGVVILKYGLTLRRGGFLEGSTLELATMAKDPSQ
jgi:hypothetical protein